MIYVLENQSIIDIAVQEDGSALAAFEWAFLNGVSITEILTPGMELKAPVSSFRNKDVAEYFKGKKQNIATALSLEVREQLTPQVGIGTMIIGTTFIVG